MPTLAVTALAALLGGVVGSFAATFAMRASEGASALSGRSRCDHCGIRLGFLQTVPVVSFAAYRGVCGSCGSPISRLHLAAEVSGVAAAASLAQFAPSALWPWGALLLLMLIFVATFDALTMRIPNAANLGLLAGGLALAAVEGRFLEACLVGAVTGLVLLGLQQAFVRVRGRSGLGMGDVKLLAALSTWTGIELTPVAILTAGLLGLGWLAWRRELHSTRKLAFAPAIAGGFWLTFIVGRAM